METRAPLVLSGLLVGGMLAVSAWAWPALSHQATIATHFDFSGQPNGFMPPLAAILVVPAAAIVFTALFALAPRFARRKEGLAASSAGYRIGWVATMMVLFVVHCAIILKARGWLVDVLGTTAIVTALMFVAIGNVLGKTRPNALVGVRTPWTRRSDYSWDKTNRAVGRMMVAVGLASLGTLAVADGAAAMRVFLTGALAIAVLSVALSYHYWRRDPARKAGNA